MHSLAAYQIESIRNAFFSKFSNYVVVASVVELPESDTQAFSEPACDAHAFAFKKNIMRVYVGVCAC